VSRVPTDPATAPPPADAPAWRIAAPALYGGDACGLICGYHFRPGEPALALESVAAAEPWLQSPREGFVWLHFNLSHAGALPWLQRQTWLSDDFFETLDGGSRATRIERDGDALFGVINDVTFDFGFDASDVSTLWLNVSERCVLSARRQPLRSVDRLRTEVKRGEVLSSSVSLLEHLLRDQADELQRVVRRAAERIDEIEDQLLAGLHHRHGTELARLRRLLVRLQRLLAPEPSALQRLLGRPPPWVSAADVQDLNGASEEFALVLRDIAALQERAKLMQDEAAGRMAEENGRSLFTLTMVTVLALPINLIAGLLGMNVGGIPLSGDAHGFWLMLGLIALLTVVIAWVATRRIRRHGD
jgi:zinc transporter